MPFLVETRVTPEFIPTKLKPNEVFVFGSNLAGRHGLGAALTAFRYYGAVYGQGRGLAGQSYALPTKDEGLCRLTLGEIREEIGHFLLFARHLPLRRFLVTKLGTGAAGYSAKQMAEEFKAAAYEAGLGKELPSNVCLPEEFWRHIKEQPEEIR